VNCPESSLMNTENITATFPPTFGGYTNSSIEVCNGTSENG